MKICIYGAGAGGGHFAVRLARAGHDVSVVARGPHLEAIRKGGLRLLSGADVLEAQVRASDDPAEFGAQDAVIVAVKATALPEVAARLEPLVGKTTSVVFPQNGIPWWYPSGLSAAYPPPPPLPTFSLAEVLLSVMRQDQVIGGIIYSANEIVAPGVIRNNSPAHNRMDIGAIDDRQTMAVSDLRNVLNQAGLLSRPVESIREAVWTKLLSNMSGSTIALVTRKKSSACRDDAAMCDIFRKLVREGAAIAAANGFPLEADPDAMLARLVDHKPSILQDYEQNRQMEIAEILLAPLAFARATSVATPTLDVFAALAKNLAAERGLASA